MKLLTLTLAAFLVILSGCETAPPPAPVKQALPCYAYVDSSPEVNLHVVVVERKPKDTTAHISGTDWSAVVVADVPVVDEAGTVDSVTTEEYRFGAIQERVQIHNPTPPLRIGKVHVVSCTAFRAEAA